MIHQCFAVFYAEVIVIVTSAVYIRSAKNHINLSWPIKKILSLAHYLEIVCNKANVKVPTAPQACRYTTLWNIFSKCTLFATSQSQLFHTTPYDRLLLSNSWYHCFAHISVGACFLAHRAWIVKSCVATVHLTITFDKCLSVECEMRHVCTLNM